MTLSQGFRQPSIYDGDPLLIMYQDSLGVTCSISFSSYEGFHEYADGLSLMGCSFIKKYMFNGEGQLWKELK